jgi:hypothetical protein
MKINIDLYAKKAKERYDKWLSENGSQLQLTAMQQYERLHEQAASIDPAIMLSSMPVEDHAYHFGALIGSDRYNDVNGRDILYSMTTAILASNPVKQYDNASIRQLTLQRFGGNEDPPHLPVVTINEQQEAVFPYLKTDSEISFHIKKIIEWEIDDPVEAEIEGIWNGEFSLSFFVTDYAVNKHLYKLNQDISVRLSAFILDISESEINKDDPEANENTNGYWPDTRYGLYSYFEFEALVMKIKLASIDKQSVGCIFTLKIIDNNRGSDLVVDAYVTNANINAVTIRKEMRVTRTLWFQGELAK